MSSQVHVATGTEESLVKSPIESDNPAHLGVSWREVEDPWRTHVCLPQ